MCPLVALSETDLEALFSRKSQAWRYVLNDFRVKRNRLGANCAKEFSVSYFINIKAFFETCIFQRVFDPLVKSALLKKVQSGDASIPVSRDVSAVFPAEFNAWATTCQSGIFPNKVSAGAMRFQAKSFSCMALAVAHVSSIAFYLVHFLIVNA